MKFIDGLNELSVPAAWLRSLEQWHWRCSAPRLLPRGWVEEHGIEAGDVEMVVKQHRRFEVVAKCR